MSFVKDVAKFGGLGVAGLAATKKLPLAAVSPAAALIKGNKKQTTTTPSLIQTSSSSDTSKTRQLI